LRLSVVRHWIAGGLLLFGSWWSAPSQTAKSAKSDGASGSARAAETLPRVPGMSDMLGGFNAGISYLGVHNSTLGWYSVATPAISYTFTPHYSADVSASIYFHRMVENLAPDAQKDTRLVLDAVDASDTFLSFHASYNPRLFQDTISASLTLPTGNASEGLGTGRVTFDFTNHVERYYKGVGFLVDLGAGDSSTLSNNIVTKDYSSLGALAHFQAGSVFWWRANYLEMLAYEQLPIGSQKVYTSFSPGGVNRTQMVSTSNAGEDNGLTVVAGIPLTSRLTALSYYNRSIRHDSDTVSMGITYVLRGSQKGKWMSLVDRALREAESEEK